MGIAENNPFTLEGKKILVTGASSGIGKAIAIECSKMGAELYITAKNPGRLENTYSSLDGVGHKMIVADLSRDSDLDKIVESVQKIDGLVHSAGVIQSVPFKYIERDNMEHIMGINFFAPVILTKRLFRKNLLANNGSIVFISSLGALSAARGNGIYSASKGALNSISGVMAIELAKKRIRVNCILPGMVKTDFVGNILSSSELDEDSNSYPLGYGEPSDVAYAAIYFLSKASKWVTGCKFIIDGGVSLS